MLRRALIALVVIELTVTTPFTVTTLHAEDAIAVVARLYPGLTRNIGGATEFDRSQFTTIHEGPDSIDMTADDHELVRRKLDGRNGGQLSWIASRTPADPSNGKMPDAANIESMGKRDKKKKRDDGIKPGDSRDAVLCTHTEHILVLPGNDRAPWGPRSYEAAAEFTAQFLKHYFTNGIRPRYLEGFNEPFVKAERMGTTIEVMCKQHNFVARRVRQLCPDVKVGGYSTTWIEVEHGYFSHWEKRQKKFMDIAGKEMDLFSYHIYDGVNVEGKPRNRTGSNADGVMDLVSTYSKISFGIAKPIRITEFGRIPEGGMDPAKYSAKRSADMLYSLTEQLMTFLDHPDCLAKVIPFILGKAVRTYTAKGQAQPGETNPFLLWRRDTDGSFIETDLMLFYQFWKDVRGQSRPRLRDGIHEAH